MKFALQNLDLKMKLITLSFLSNICDFFSITGPSLCSNRNITYVFLPHCYVELLLTRFPETVQGPSMFCGWGAGTALLQVLLKASCVRNTLESNSRSMDFQWYSSASSQSK